MVGSKEGDFKVEVGSKTMGAVAKLFYSPDDYTLLMSQDKFLK